MAPLGLLYIYRSAVSPTIYIPTQGPISGPRVGNLVYYNIGLMGLRAVICYVEFTRHRVGIYNAGLMGHRLFINVGQAAARIGIYIYIVGIIWGLGLVYILLG